MKSNRARRGAQGQVVLGVLVIALGLLFLLDNLGLIELGRVLAFWPLLIVVLGIVKLVDTDSSNDKVLGIVLIALGATLLLNRLGYFYFTWHMTWPLLLIALGALLVYRAAAGRHVRASSATPELAQAVDSDSVIEATAILGGLERRVTSAAFRGGDVTAILGGCMLDLRGASIQREARLDVFALFGGITIKCPPDWTVVVRGTPILGGFDHKSEAPGTDTSKRLVVSGYAIMGGVDIRS
jgi:hypothetical protein